MNEAVGYLLIAEDGDEQDAKYPNCVELDEGARSFNIGNHVEADQWRQLSNVLDEFSDVFSSKPGWTDLVEAVLKDKDPTPCVVPYYRVPETMKDEVKDQLRKLLEDGFVRESDSEFATGLVVVKKEKITVFFCAAISHNWMHASQKTKMAWMIRRPSWTKLPMRDIFRWLIWQTASTKFRQSKRTGS